MNKKREIIIYAAFIFVILLTVAFIFGNSVKGPEESTEQSNEVVEIVRPIIDPNENMSDSEFSFLVRKSGHFIEYTILGIECACFAYYIFKKISPMGTATFALGCLLTANIDEYIQSFTDRGSQVADVLLDFGGALFGMAVGYALAYIVLRIAKRSKIKSEILKK